MSLSHPLTNFEIYSRGNLHKVKDSVYIRNLNEYINIGTYWVAFMLKIIMQYVLIVLVLNISQFISFILNNNRLTYFTNLFSSKNFSPNKARLFEGSFFWGVPNCPPHPPHIGSKKQFDLCRRRLVLMIYKLFGEKLSGEVKKYKVGAFADTATFNDQLLMSCPTKY